MRVGVFAAAALAHDETTVHRTLEFARLQSASLGIVATSDAVSTSYRPHVFVTDDGRWREITPPRVLWQLEAVVFSSPRVGWVVANDCSAGKAAVYRTSDGGQSWSSASVPSTNCAAGSRLVVSFSDTEHGWILDIFESGNRDPLARTSDGGKTWHKVSPSGPLAGTIVFTTSRDGWASRSDFASPQQLYATSDGGGRWQHRSLAAPVGWKGAALFPDAPRFFGQRGVLPVDVVLAKRTGVAFYTTADGGVTWQPGAVHAVESPIVTPRSPFVRYVPTSIVSPTVWWVAAGRERSAVAVTSDAGKSWQRSTLPAGSAEISAGSARRAWLTTSQTARALYVTNDGGRSWRRQALPAP